MICLGLNRFAPKSLAAAGLLLGLTLTALAPVPAAAQMTPEQACTNDAFRLCNDAIPDRDKVGACLRRNARSLSPDCRGFRFPAYCCDPGQKNFRTGASQNRFLPGRTHCVFFDRTHVLRLRTGSAGRQGRTDGPRSR